MNPDEMTTTEDEEMDPTAYDPDDYENEVLALAKALNVHPDVVEDKTHHGRSSWEVDGTEYIVVDNEGKEDLINSYLDSYLDEFVYTQIPNNLKPYFNEKSWKSDAEMDLDESEAFGDGWSEEVNVGGEWYYIYRQ